MDEEKLHRTCCGEGMEKAVKYVGRREMQLLPTWRTKMRFGEAESFFKAKRKLLHEESLRYLLTIPKNRRKPSETV